MANAALENGVRIKAPERKETLNYQIRTEGFEKILLAMQHITQRIKKGEKCVARIEYDPAAPFTKITTAIERSGKEPDKENEKEPLLATVERIADKYARLVEKHIDEIAGDDLREIREDIRMLAHVTATMQRLFHMESVDFSNRDAKENYPGSNRKCFRFEPSIVINTDGKSNFDDIKKSFGREFEDMWNSYQKEVSGIEQPQAPDSVNGIESIKKSKGRECIEMAMVFCVPLDYVVKNYDFLSKEYKRIQDQMKNERKQ